MSQDHQSPEEKEAASQAFLGQTVMEFTYVEFDNNWSRAFIDNYKLALIDGASLLVVAEGSTGIKTTYWFRVRKDDHVWIAGANANGVNIIFIPSRCSKAKPGDHSSCARLVETHG